MRKSDFHYHLPAELIAQMPSAERGMSRLLAVHRADGRLEDRRFGDIVQYLHPGDVLVFNNTRVLRARMFGRKRSGGRVEILVERILDAQRFLAQVRCSKPLKPGAHIDIATGAGLVVEAQVDQFWLLRSEQLLVDALLMRYGHIPLPPYITRADEVIDEERYQTVFASVPGAVAAPTAGLHFNEELLATLRAHEVDLQFITLHVGAGTFQPLRQEDIRAHRMHAELFSIDATTATAINRAKRERRRIVAVGTTVVRALESAGRNGMVESVGAETEIFIYPGYRFQIIDAMITNFHLPESTLLMLVSAFAGRELIMRAYEHAVQERYRFFSYGDAMLID